MLPPTPSSSGVSSRMSRQRVRDTVPELEVRRLLHSHGLRFRVDIRPLPELRRKADLVFRPARVAVFIDGCFWHSCPQHGTLPAANREWWAQKLQRNTARDRETDRVLADAGWISIRAWEHEDPAEVAARVEAAVRSRPRS